MWEKEKVKKISGNNRKRRSIRVKVYLYEVFLYYIITCLICYITTILTLSFYLPFVAYITPGERSSVSICHEYLSVKRTKNNINGRGQGC